MIDPKTIEKIAELARLEISEKEVAKFSSQLTAALNYFEQISQVNSDQVEPLVTPTEITAQWRADEAKQETTVEEIMSNAPEKRGHLFAVPPVV